MDLFHGLACVRYTLQVCIWKIPLFLKVNGVIEHGANLLPNKSPKYLNMVRMISKTRAATNNDDNKTIHTQFKQVIFQKLETLHLVDLRTTTHKLAPPNSYYSYII